ncbi:hypothetical protein D5086_027780 [Populus alba]|uniref:Uncharacterized protein n=1 Tax=Populus alba TaxID=43335 RepID=A0ACC4AX54_POPAL
MCSFGDREVQKDMELSPYKIVNRDGKPYIEAKIEDEETRALSPEEISGHGSYNEEGDSRGILLKENQGCSCSCSR